MFAILLVTGLFLLVLGTSGGPTDYACPGSCNALSTCQCGSLLPPGGLSPRDAPQFIVLTNDDADPNMIRQLYLDNHEIATHTISHPSYPNFKEIVGAKMWLNETANVPLEKIKGFRAPFLSHNPGQRQMLHQGGFTYDSTLTETFGPHAASPSAGERIWPFTMDHGIPVDCTVGTGLCAANESWPGLWEFPLWTVQDEDGAPIASMDPVGNNYKQYVREFNRNYHGNRTPLGLYMHAGLLMAFNEHQGQINNFLEWALTHDDVWLVTISEVLRWMKDPVPASQYQWDCTKPQDMYMPGDRICFQPDGGCLQGAWNTTKCACDCLHQYDQLSNGFCPDPYTGACTVRKDYDFNNRTYNCPAESNPPKTVPIPEISPQPSPSSSSSLDPTPPAPSPSVNATTPIPSPSMPSPKSMPFISPSPSLTTSSPSPQTSIPSPRSPVELTLKLRGLSPTEAVSTKRDAICGVVAHVALVDASKECNVTAASSIATSPLPTATAQVQVRILLLSTTPDATRMVVQSAAQYGSLAAAFEAAGITFDSLSEWNAGSSLSNSGNVPLPNNLSLTSPSVAGDVPFPSSSPSMHRKEAALSGNGGGSSKTGAIIGGVVGGVVGVLLAAAATFLIVKKLQTKRTTEGGGLRASYQIPRSSKAEQVGGASIINAVASFHQAHTTGYNASPRSIGNVTPRHGAGRKASFDPEIAS